MMAPLSTQHNNVAALKTIASDLSAPDAIGGPLAALDQACRLLAASRDLAEVKAIRDMAEAARLYARAIDRGLEAQNHAAEIKLRAERRAGELLADVPRERGFAHWAQPEPNATSARAEPTLTPYQETLERAAISLPSAKRWQQMATVPESIFEDTIATTRDAGQELTSAVVLRAAVEQQRAERKPQPLPDNQPGQSSPLLRFCPPDMSSATIMAAIIRVSFPDARSALDMTYGLGNFWDGTASVDVTARDSNPARALHGVADFRALSDAEESYDIAVFDPPHIADGGEDSIMGQRFGTYSNEALEDAIRRGCREAWRVARLGVVIKVTDGVHGQRLVRESRWVEEAIPAELYEVVHQTRDRNLSDPKWGEQLSAYNNGSTYLVFRKDGALHVRRKTYRMVAEVAAD